MDREPARGGQGSGSRQSAGVACLLWSRILASPSISPYCVLFSLFRSTATDCRPSIGDCRLPNGNGVKGGWLVPQHGLSCRSIRQRSLASRRGAQLAASAFSGYGRAASLHQYQSDAEGVVLVKKAASNGCQV